MKLFLLLTLAFVAVRMSSAQIFRNGQNSGKNDPDPEPFHCADCTPWDENLAQLNGVRWLCTRSNPPMQCPIRHYAYCKKYCEGAARAAPEVEDDEI